MRWGRERGGESGRGRAKFLKTIERERERDSLTLEIEGVGEIP